MKTQWIALSSAALLVVILVAAGGCQVTRAGYETAPYRVTESDGAFEIREYPTLQWVETPMGSGMGDKDGSFGRLFGFITGRNQSQQKIAMTTPVYMAGSPTHNPSSPRVMAFVMPKDMGSNSVPVPSDAAVRRRRSSEREGAVLVELQAWLAGRGLSVTDPMPIYGYFDPPWTPSVFRRNEVMLRLAEPAAR
jgi:hypothetical protein